jgi:import receptor subunit TOM70
VEGFKAATARFPDCVECYALYAKVLQEKDDMAGSDDMYKKGIELNPANANLLVHRALLALHTTKDMVAVERAVQKALEVDEKCEFAWETIGQIHIQKDNMEKAVEAFDKVMIRWDLSQHSSSMSRRSLW